MSTRPTYLQFILDQLSGLPQISYRMMMGEYILYYRGRIAAYLCDNALLVRPTPHALQMLPDAPRVPPYEGAKDMLLVEETDDRAFLTALFEAIYDELPTPRPKRKPAQIAPHTPKEDIQEK